jgi:hypothetical protein
MFKRVKDNFRQGIDRIRWFSTLFAERVKIEIAIIKLLYQSDEMDKRKAEILRSIGQRVYDFKGNPEKSFLKDRVVIEAVTEIEKIERDVEDLRQKVSDMSRVNV